MAEYLKKVAGQIGDFFRNLSPVKKAAVALTLMGVLGAMAGLFIWAGQKTYRPLMTNLNPEDATNIMRILREKRIPYRVDASGRNVEVPPESIHDLRLELATLGLPQSSVVGYELFDKQSLGQTGFVQKVNQKRALEGELMRTINTIKGVKRSRVHLVMPEKSAFVEDQKKTTASVVLDVETGTVLSEKQIFGIGNLVARAVEGMDPSDVVIVDSNGKTLSKNQHDPLIQVSASQLEYQRKFEEEMEKRIEQMLSRVVGDGKVVARVNAEIDFNKVDETQTLFDPDGAAVRMANKNTESLEAARPVAQGPAGAASNLPGDPAAQTANQIRNNTQKTHEVSNYEVPTTVRRVAKSPGTVSRLSVAVLVDGKMIKSADKDGKILSKSEAWAPEKLKEFETLVRSAVGINAKRGDVIEVKNMEFTREDFEEATKVLADAERRSYVQNLAVYALILLIISLFFFFVVRPFIKWLTENTIDSVDTFLPKTIEELERIQKNGALPGLEETVPVFNEKIAPEKVEGEMIKEKIITLVDTAPQKAAMILHDWIRGVEATKDENAGAEGEDKAAG